MFSSALLDLAVMCCVMGVTAFGMGMLPLSFPLAKDHLARLSTLGTGLLIGAGLGVIIPEGIEATIANSRGEIPTTTIALSILLGFAFMLLVEEYAAPHAKPLTPQTSSTNQSSDVNFDIDLEELQREEGTSTFGSIRDADSESMRRAFPLSFGLLVHALVDGYALGVSAAHSESLTLSLVVFLAIIVHKAPTALALTTSLLAASVPPAECKRHLTYFSLSTPFGAMLSYSVYSLLASGPEDRWIGIALLFSGGTFLYVATVLQPVSEHSSEHTLNTISKGSRTFLLTIGMFLPLVISKALGRDHH